MRASDEFCSWEFCQTASILFSPRSCCVLSTTTRNTGFPVGQIRSMLLPWEEARNANFLEAVMEICPSGRMPISDFITAATGIS